MKKPELTLKHIGINAPDSAQAEALAQMFSETLGLEYKPGNSSVFAGTQIEVMRTPFLGKNGHIGFGVPSIEDCEAYFTSVGHPYQMETAKRDAEGRLKAVYLEGDFGGFAVHLMRN